MLENIVFFKITTSESLKVWRTWRGPRTSLKFANQRKAPEKKIKRKFCLEFFKEISRAKLAVKQIKY